VPARVSLGVTTLLTMSTQQASINNSLPPVAYTKAIDVWTGVCIFFVFAALLEYALVNYASRSDAQRLAKRKQKKQVELDKCAFDPEHMEESHNGGSFPMKPMMRGSPGPPGGMRPPPGTNFANINNIHQCEIHMKPRKRKNFLQAWLNKFPSRAKKIDVLARVIFPAIFAFFNMSYWTFYLTQEANTDVK